MTRFVELWTHVCLTYRKTVLAALVLITAVAVSRLDQAQFNNSIEQWFLDDDPAIVGYNDLLETFGSDELIVVGLDAPDVFTPAVLESIERVTRKLTEAPHVEKVFSLTNIESIMGNDGELVVGDLVEFPLDPSTLPAIRKRALTNKMYVGNVVSADGTFAAVIARLPHIAAEFDYKLEAMAAVDVILAAEPFRYYHGGAPVIDKNFYHLSELDGRVTTSLMGLMLVAALWLLLRSFWGVVIPFVTVAVGVAWTLGWIVWAGYDLTVTTPMLPPLLLAVGVADSMHVLVDYQNRCRLGEEKLVALRSTYGDLLVPCLLTSLTTGIGLLALTVSKVSGIRQFGAFAALGVFGAFFLSVTFVPIALSYLPQPRLPGRRAEKDSRFVRGLLGLHELTMRRGSAIVATSVVITVLAVAGATRVKSESAFLEFFKDSDPVKQDILHMQDRLGGAMTMDVVIDTGRPDGVKDPEVLQLISGLQRHLETLPVVSATQSAADYFRDMRRAFFDNDQAQYRLPETSDEAAQYLFLYELAEPDGDISEFVTFDYRTGRLTARVAVETSAAAKSVVAATNAYVAKHFPPEITARANGIVLLYAIMEDYIRLSLITGFSIALVLIFLVLSAYLRSFTVGAIAMIPNVLPIIVCLGFMGVAGILLDTMTAMVASIAIGLAVDDTVHFVSRLRLHLRADAPMREALRATTVEMGRALVFTSVTLMCGFGVMMFASFRGTIYFGMLCSITIVVALAADLLLLPVILRWYGRARVAGRSPTAPALETVGREA